MQKINVIIEKKNKRYFIELQVKNLAELIAYLREIFNHSFILITITKNSYKI